MENNSKVEPSIKSIFPPSCSVTNRMGIQACPL